MNEQALWQAFLEAYPIDSLQQLSLDQYTDVERDNAFIYWLEFRTAMLGGIGGGSAFKFGIYRRNSNEPKPDSGGRCYNDTYAWYQKYGQTQEEAWQTIKETLLAIVNAAQAGDIEAIDKIKFSESLKWKIAFLYQNQQQYSVLNIFKHEALVYLCKNIGVTVEGNKLSYPSAYRALLEYYQDYARADILGLAETLWHDWEEREEKASAPYDQPIQHWLIPLKTDGVDFVGLTSLDKVSPDDYLEGFHEWLAEADIHKGDKLILCDQHNILSIGQVDEVQQNGVSWVQSRFNVRLPESITANQLRLLTPQEQVELWALLDAAKPKPKAQNIILYGPPGTGKTYSVVERALKLILSDEAFFAIKGNQQEMASVFADLQSHGQIEFVTFHQSYSYEEFVEGLRPVIDDEETGDVRYEIHKGILKRIAERATTSDVITSKNTSYADKLNDNPAVWKISLFAYDIEGLKQDCFSKGIARIGWDKAGDLISDAPSEEEQNYRESLGAQNQSTLDSFSTGIKVGDIVVSLKNQKTADAIGIVTKPYYFNENLAAAKNCIDVDWIYQGDIDIHALNGGVNLTLKTVYRLSRIKPEDILAAIPQLEKHPVNMPSRKATKQYVLIVDEINRGNLSKIFGELITLLEPSKRIGQSEALKLRLPYSNTEFSLPSNLHVIGTMNTADRSIALMDVALRRRFTFEELMPDAEVIKTVLYKTQPDTHFVDLVVDVFETINRRIRFIYDRDHQLGHAYFLAAVDYDSFKWVMLDRVIPLLQEYFYGDWEKIALALGCPYETERAMPKRRGEGVVKGEKYVAPLISATVFDEQAILGFDHDDYQDQIEYGVNDHFVHADNEGLIRYFLNILSLDQQAYDDRFNKLIDSLNHFVDKTVV